MGGKVGEGHGGASGAEDSAGGEGGHAVAHSGWDRAGRAGRGAGERGEATCMAPMRRDRMGG